MITAKTRIFLLLIASLFILANFGEARDPFNTMQGDRYERNRRTVPKTLNVFNAVVIGIVKKSESYVALIRGSDGRVYSLAAGDPLYDGKVLRIDSRSVTFLQRAGKKTVQVKKNLHAFPDYNY